MIDPGCNWEEVPDRDMTSLLFLRHRRILAAALFCCLAPGANAADGTGGSAYDRVWGYTELYRSDDGLVRTFDLSGRLQGEATWFDADQGDFDDLLWRRFRFGFVSELAGGWVAQLEGDFDLNESSGDWYTRLTDAYIGWQPGGELDLRVLKHSAGFTLDGATSSKKLLTLQRNNVTNNLWFTAEYFTGISATGVIDDRWHYRAGVFSADGDDEIGISDGGVFFLASLGHDWAQALDMKSAFVRLDYVNNEEDEESNTRDFSDVMTLVTQWEQGSWGLWTDLSMGRGYFDQSDIWGLSMMPFYNTSERVQWVFRYTYLRSDDDNGLRLGRYENEIVSGRGDEYNEAYAGLNLFFYGHKLKWQTGLQYATMDDDPDDGGEYDGWGITTGLRIYW